MKTSTIVLFTGLALQLSACSAKVTSPSQLGPNFDPGGPVIKSELVSNDVVQGTWSVNCSKVNSNWVSASNTFQGNRLSSTHIIFQDSSCSQVYLQQTNTGTFSLSTDSKNGAGYYAIDFNVEAKGQNEALTEYNLLHIVGDELYEGDEDAIFRPSSVNANLALKKGVELVSPSHSLE